MGYACHTLCIEPAVVARDFPDAKSAYLSLLLLWLSIGSIGFAGSEASVLMAHDHF